MGASEAVGPQTEISPISNPPRTHKDTDTCIPHLSWSGSSSFYSLAADYWTSISFPNEGEAK